MTTKVNEFYINTKYKLLAMNILLICALCLIGISFSNAGVLPERLAQNACHRSDKNFQQCVLEQLENQREYFINGVPEVGYPGLDPLIINKTTVDRTLNELISIKAIITNARLTGLRDTIIEYVKADPNKLTGEISLRIPHAEVVMEHDVSGQLLIIPLRSRGYFKGNFTDITLNMKAKFRRYVKDGEEYFRVDKFDVKSTVGNGLIKIISKNPQLQFSADLIANFYNENPRLVMDAINPIYTDYSSKVIAQEIDNLLARIPAKELLPE